MREQNAPSGNIGKHFDRNQIKLKRGNFLRTQRDKTVQIEIKIVQLLLKLNLNLKPVNEIVSQLKIELANRLLISTCLQSLNLILQTHHIKLVHNINAVSWFMVGSLNRILSKCKLFVPQLFVIRKWFGYYIPVYDHTFIRPDDSSNISIAVIFSSETIFSPEILYVVLFFIYITQRNQK